MTRVSFGLCLFFTMVAGGGGAALAQVKVEGDAKAEVKAGAGGAEASASGSASASADADEPNLAGATQGTNVGPGGEQAVRRTWEDIVVVPRKAFLKGGRVELAPFTGISLNDVLIRHYSFGGHLSYYLTDVFSVGLEGQYYIKERTGRESLVGLQYNRVSTLNKYKYGGALNFGYVPGYGKFTLFNKYILHWDIFAIGGVGLIWTEIIPRKPGDLTFQNMNIAPNVGVGTRFFLNDWLTVSVAFRDYIFADKYEPVDRKIGEDIEAVKSRADSRLVNNMMLFASVGFYLPTSFQYRSPR